jgi:hypothetical protein
VAAFRWLFVLLFWAALDLSGPLLPVPVEAIEEWEDAAHRVPLRRRDRQSDVRATSERRQEMRDAAAARLSRFVAAAAPRRGHDAGTVRKLPPPWSDSDSPADDH